VKLYVCVRNGCWRGYIGSSPEADIDHPHGPTTYRLAAIGEVVLVKCRSIAQCNCRVEMRAPLEVSGPPLCDLHMSEQRKPT
jgi:hypothetical protein